MMGFGDLHQYARAPRVGSVALSPDGTWVALAVQTVGGTPPKYLTSIWRVDTERGGVPVRLTRSAEGEGSPVFLPDGSLAFVSRRPDGTASGGPDKPAAKPALWLLPAGGGEARRIAAPGGGVSGVSAAGAASVLAYSAATFRGRQAGEEDAALRKARTDAGVAAILHDSGRLRHWDHDLGAEQLRLLVAEVPAAAAAGQDADTALATARDLTPEPGRALDEQSFELTPDGAAVVTGWVVTAPDGDARTEIVIIDTATAQRRTLLAGPGLDFESPKVSPDGKLVVAIRLEHDTYDRPGGATLVLTSMDGGEPRSVSRLHDRALSHVGLRVTGYSILSRLAAEGPMPVGDLAGRLAMERTTCTREVAPLVRSGLVEAAAGPDRRQRILRLTSLGEQKRADAYPIWERVQQEVAAEFGGAEVQELLIRLRRLTGGSERLGGIRTEVDH